MHFFSSKINDKKSESDQSESQMHFRRSVLTNRKNSQNNLRIIVVEMETEIIKTANNQDIFASLSIKCYFIRKLTKFS